MGGEGGGLVPEGGVVPGAGVGGGGGREPADKLSRGQRFTSHLPLVSTLAPGLRLCDSRLQGLLGLSLLLHGLRVGVLGSDHLQLPDLPPVVESCHHQEHGGRQEAAQEQTTHSWSMHFHFGNYVNPSLSSLVNSIFLDSI